MWRPSEPIGVENSIGFAICWTSNQETAALPDTFLDKDQPANRFARAREAQAAAVLEDYVEMIGDLIEEFGEARVADIAARIEGQLQLWGDPVTGPNDPIINPKIVQALQ